MNINNTFMKNLYNETIIEITNNYIELITIEFQKLCREELKPYIIISFRKKEDYNIEEELDDISFFNIPEDVFHMLDKYYENQDFLCTLTKNDDLKIEINFNN
jgi:hypothetical protein